MLNVHHLLLKEVQEKQMMDMQQFATVQGLGGQNGSPTPGAAGPDQEAGSPKVRRNENERGEQPGQAQNAEANSAAPNPGQS